MVAFAESIGRRPGIIVGRLHHDGKLNRKYLRATLAKVSPFLRDWVDRPAPLSLVKEIDRASARSTMKMTS